jgi:hypothetical protein
MENQSNKQKKLTLIDKIKNQEVIENKYKNEDLSDIEKDEDEDTYSKMSEKDYQQNIINNDLKQKIITYIKIDDAIKKKQEEIKNFKQMKKPCEEAIISYLELNNEDAFNLNSGDRIIKNKVEHKAPIKLDIIKGAIKEELFKENMVETEERCENILNEILDLIDKKRPTKTKITIRRSVPKKKK